jgi:hypothetical protein
VAVARHLAAPVSFQRAAPLAPGDAEKFRHLNPSLRLPILAEESRTAFLPFNDVARLPLADFPSVKRWHQPLMSMPAWADPFAGLSAPELPPLPA